MAPEQLVEQGPVALMRLAEVERLVDAVADIDADRRDDEAEEEGNAPGAALDIRIHEELGDDEADEPSQDTPDILAGELPAAEQRARRRGADSTR